MGLALFDADGTLFPNPSSESRFIRHLMRRGRLGPAQLYHACAFMVRAWPCYGRHVGRKNKAYLCGLRTEEIATLARTFVAEEIVPRLRPALLARIRAHRDRGDRLVLLTGTPEFIARPLAAHLEMDEVVATRPAVRDGRFTADPPLRHPLGLEKLDLARDLGQRLGIPAKDWTAYGDSRYDIPLLEHCGQAVAVTPDAHLAALAKARGWEILNAG